MKIAFSGSPLDRASHLRRDHAWLGERVAAEESRFLVLWKLQALLKGAESDQIAWANHEIRDVMSANPPGG